MANVDDLQSLLRSLCANTQGEDVSIRELLAAVGRRSYGPVLLLLGLIAISPVSLIPGANWLTAALTLVFAVQMAFGKAVPWIPRRLLQIEFPRSYLEETVERFIGPAASVDKLLKPRFTFLTGFPFILLIALVCVVSAVVTFPLALLPLGPLLPSLAILLLGLGLTARDGVVLLVALLSVAAAVAVLGRVWNILPSFDLILQAVGLT